MIIYIRHGEDFDAEATVHHHDGDLTSEGRERSRLLAQYLVRTYGKPDRVYLSPFRRCRSTFQAMQGAIDTLPKVKIDASLSRHFSRREQANPQVTKRTQRHRPPIEESLHDFHHRARYRAERLRQRRDRSVIWCITHALVFKQAAKVFGVETPDRIAYLGYFVVGKRERTYYE